MDELLELPRQAGAPARPTAPPLVPGAWALTAACADPAVPSPVRVTFTSDLPTAHEAAALAVCSSCPVREACAAYGGRLRGRHVVGVWGGRRAVLPKLRPGRAEAALRRRAA